jgi:hypothetical protein
MFDIDLEKRQRLGNSMIVFMEKAAPAELARVKPLRIYVIDYVMDIQLKNSAEETCDVAGMPACRHACRMHICMNAGRQSRERQLYFASNLTSVTQHLMGTLVNTRC